jgi:hypothetical protein
MRRRKGRLAKLLSVPVLAVCGFAVAATLAGVGIAGVTTSSTPTTTSSTTPPTTTTTTTTPTGNEGCTPGFWKNHPDAWVGTGFSTAQTLGSVFDASVGDTNLGTLANVTLLDALSFQGGPTVTDAKQILLRAAVAALLNSASPDVDFSMTTDEVIAAVDEALASNNRATILDLAAELDAANNAGCPL